MHAKFQVYTSNFRTDVFFYTVFRPVARTGPEKVTGSRREKTSDRKSAKFSGGRVWRLMVAPVQKNQQNPMYMHKSMVCKVSTFSYNSSSTGVPIYHGSIDSIKDRCVIRTSAKKISAHMVLS